MLSKQVIKNAIVLYLRMLVLIGITLFTTKLLLEYLGVIDFGVYSLVWGIILLLGFFNNSITNSVQRFLNVTIPTNNTIKLHKIYSMSVIVFLALGSFLALILLIFKDILFFKFLNIPTGKEVVANKIYYLMVGSFFINFLSLNFHSCIISMEKFSFYAFITIIESLLKLLSVVILVKLTDKLFFYSLFLLLSSILVFVILYIYCKKEIYFCKFTLVKKKEEYKELVGFVSWNVFGSFGVIISAQGVPLVANIFYGVIINGSLSIAGQLNALIGTVTSNFQKAFSPYLMKNFVSSNSIADEIFVLTKVSVIFYSIVALPLIFYANSFLIIWLNKVPPYVEGIVKISAVISLCEVLAGPLWMLIQAEGNIKVYQVSVLLVMIFSVPSSYFLLYLGFDIYDVWYMLLFLNVLLLFVRVCFVHLIIELNFFVRYLKTVVLPAITFLTVSSFVVFLISFLIENRSILDLIFLNLLNIVFIIFFAHFLLLDKYQRQGIYKLAKTILNKI